MKISDTNIINVRRKYLNAALRWNLNTHIRCMVENEYTVVCIGAIVHHFRQPFLIKSSNCVIVCSIFTTFIEFWEYLNSSHKRGYENRSTNANVQIALISEILITLFIKNNII